MNEKIIAKLRKLLALSQSSNQHEAEAALAKANELMTQHQIQMSDVEFSIEKSVKFTHEGMWTKGFKMKLMWPGYVAEGVAKLYDGSTMTPRRWTRGVYIWFVGKPAQVELMKITYQALIDFWFAQVDRDLKDAKDAFEAAMAVKGLSANWTPKMTMDFKQGHGDRFGNVIYWRCRDMVDARKKAVQATGRALVVTDSEVDEYKKSIGCKDAAKARKSSQGSELGRYFGDQAGKAAPIAAGALKHQETSNG